ncbi:alpha/beta fold hydrolase [Massilia soli]|uniref:Alpha/beta hydrolase n=1 Tax=Massilia soli TaxID=2792854 RepID=A0ABS7SLI8_9BURK|nr:alpha/beta fold hydrolase [Massilia soli]MBZ2206690.1 alpha/beta hydrolase [Massilia soli]
MTMLNRVLSAALLSIIAGAAHGAGFAPCPDAATRPELNGSLCATERVPGDPAGASGGPAADIALFIRKFPAMGASRGQAWLIAGGPGESGASFYGLLPKLRESFPGFNLIVPDHRGTGLSTRMCPDEEAAGSTGGASLDGAEWGTCFASLNANPAYARQFSQTNAAHDLKLLLERLPARGKTYVYGVSYGTQLVLRTVALGAANIDGVVLDSLVSLQDDDKADLSRRSLVADAVGRQILAGCDASARCSARMGAPVETIYRALLARADKDPALLAAVPGGNLKRFFGSLLDVPTAASQIPAMIKDLNEGRADTVKAVLADVERQMAPLGGFPQTPPSIPLVIVISGAENNLQPGRTVEEVRKEEAGLLFTSSLPGDLVGAPLPLYARDAWFARLPEKLPPTLVIHGDRDGKTPHDAAVRHIAALRKAGPVQLHTAREGGHFVLWSDNSCARHTVAKFVLGSQLKTGCVSVASSH